MAEGYSNYHSFVKIGTQESSVELNELTAQAYDNVLLTKSVAFKGIRNRKKAILKANSPEIKTLYDSWIAQKQELICLYQMSQASDLEQTSTIGSNKERFSYEINQERVEELQKEVDQLENRLVNEANNFKTTLQLDDPSWKELRAKLKPGEAAIEMVRFQWRDQLFYSDSAFYTAYIIKHNSPFPEVVYLPQLADALDSCFYKGYRNAIRLKLEDAFSYEVYWKVIQEKLDGIDKVYFSPDGIYHLINLPTLKNMESGQYLLDELDIQYVTTTAAIGKPSDTSMEGSAVLIGRPKYSLTKEISVDEMSTRSFTRNFRNAEISDLPRTEIEVKAIKAELESYNIGVSQYVGTDVTEDIIYELQSPEILHIATHGFWSETENAT